ncbi:MAG TPA: hypothetical protein VMY35_03745 [Phycisphaerae bacterium]|nr:hypothetical protein [Phycisphaerae bacterium]
MGNRQQTRSAAPKARENEYPELMKFRKADAERMYLDAFLEWLVGQRQPPVVLCESTGRGLGDGQPYAPISVGPEKLLAEYFGIDMAKLETERRALLATIRAANP